MTLSIAFSVFPHDMEQTTMNVSGEIGKRLDDLECTIEQSNLKRREIANVLGDLQNEFPGVE